MDDAATSPSSGPVQVRPRQQIDGALRSAISQAIVRIHAEYYGKGATQAKTYAWDDLIVTVREGRVRVTPSSKSTKSRASFDEPQELSVPITADFQLRTSGTWPVTPRRIDVRYALAWRERQLMFKVGDTLADAVEEFNLRNRLQLRLDPRAGSLPVRGTFDASDPVAFAQTVDKTSPVAVRRLAADTLLIKAE